MIDTGYEILRRASRGLPMVSYSHTSFSSVIAHLKRDDTNQSSLPPTVAPAPGDVGGLGPSQCQTQTADQWLETQQVQLSPQGYNMVTGNDNKHTKHCKGLHTLLYEFFSRVAATCPTPTNACRKSHGDCHQSQKPVSLTICEHTSGRYQDCRYTEATGRILHQKGGLQYPLVLVPWMLWKARNSLHPKDSCTATAMSSFKFFTNPYPLCKYHFFPHTQLYILLIPERVLGMLEMRRAERCCSSALHGCIHCFLSVWHHVTLQALRILARIGPGWVRPVAYVILETIFFFSL